jgi:hypothetical protein
MAPSIDGDVHRFAEHGLYNGLFLLRDEESGTYWDHMTGEAVYGPLVGSTLEVSYLMQSTVAQVLGRDSGALIAISDRGRAMRTDEQMTLGGLLGSIGGRLSRLFSSTVEEEDDRRPTMDLGMGIWDGEEARYYPYDRITADGNAVLDNLAGRQVVVYLDPSAYALAAAYIDTDGITWEEKVLRFSDGSYIEGGVFHDTSGERAQIERPRQVFTRWYGFALTFPETEIYDESPRR